MFVDDSPRYPMTFVVEFKFSGDVREDAFQEAYRKALQRHPLLRSHIRKAKANRDCWVAAEEYDSDISWNDLDAKIFVDGTGEFLDLRNGIGVRCWVRKNSAEALVTFVFHHSACDGIGAYQFIGDVLWYYAVSQGEDLPPLVELNERDVKARIKSMLDFELVRAAEQSEPVKHSLAAPVAPCSQERESLSESQHSFPAFATRTFDKNEFRQLRLKAQEDGQTTNSRLLQSLFIALKTWNQEFSAAGVDDTPFIVNMPMDLRQPENPPFSAINLVTSAFVKRLAAAIEDLGELERTLNEEILKLKHTRFHSEFMKMLLQWPLDLEESKSKYDPSQCHSSVVFSNTGDPTKRFLAQLTRKKGLVHSGNLVLEDINGTPPLRNQTRSSISIFSYRRELRICLRMDQDLFSDSDADRFVQHFANCFESGGSQPVSPSKL